MKIPSAVVAAVLAFGVPHALAQSPKTGGTLTFAVSAEPPNYDCHAQSSFAFIHPVRPHYSTLLKFDTANYPKVVGDLAESWTVSPDGLTYTFKLKRNVKFHDGSAFTAEDIRATYDRLRKPPEGVRSLREETYKDIASIDTPDAQTVVFKLSKTNASMLSNFASPWDCVYSAAKLKADPKFPERNILGTGAFSFVEHQAGSHWVGRKFDGYFQQGKPYLDSYRAVFMSGAPMVNALSAGQVLVEFRGHSPADRDRLVQALGDRAVVVESPWVCSLVVSFNAKKKPFDDPRVRRALSLGIDRWTGAQALQKIALVRHVGGLLRPGYDLAISEQDLVKLPGFSRDINAARAEARRLLKEAGAENLTFKLTNRNVAMPYTPVGVFLIDQWRQIGLTVQHEQLETRLYLAAQQRGIRRMMRRLISTATSWTSPICSCRSTCPRIVRRSIIRATSTASSTISTTSRRESSTGARRCAAARVRAPAAGSGLRHPYHLVAPHHRPPQADERLAHHAQPLCGAGPDRRLAGPVRTGLEL